MHHITSDEGPRDEKDPSSLSSSHLYQDVSLKSVGRSETVQLCSISESYAAV